MFFLTLIPVALFFHLARAFPHSPVASPSGPFPPDVNHIAHDERTGSYLAYRDDGSLYGSFNESALAFVHGKRADPSRCFPLNVADAQGMVGWNKIEAHANKNWGTGKRQVVINPPEYLDNTAIVCPTDKVVDVKFAGGSNCIDSRFDVEGQLIDTNGTIRLTLIQGYSNSAGWTVTKSSAFGVSVTVTATFHIPEVLDVGGSLTTTVDITNSLASSFDTRIDNFMSQDLWMSSPKGKMCFARMNTKTCSVMGKGKLRQTASGWVWFNYGAPTGPGGHRKWAVNIDKLITVEERSSYLEFAGSMKAQVRSKYEAICK